MDVVKVGIVGIGGRGYGFASMLRNRKDARVVAVADRNRVRAERARANAGLDFETHQDVDGLLKRDDVDAVIVTTPDYLHREHAVAALKAGKHLLVDKPIATTVPDGLAILEESKRSDRVLVMGFNLRYVSTLNEAKKLIDAGRIGTPFYLAAAEYYSGGKTYMSRWNRLKKYTGGLFLHKGSHDFDILNWFNHPARPARVSAFGGVNNLNPESLPFTLEPGEEAGPNCAACKVAFKCPDAQVSYISPDSSQKPLFDAETAKEDGYLKDLCIFLSDKDTFDNAVAIIEYDNSTRAMHSEVFVTALSNRVYSIAGSHGHLEIDLHACTIKEYPRWTRNVITHNIAPAQGGHGGSDPTLVDSFLGAVTRGERPRAGAIDGIWSIAAGVAAELSRAEQRTVEIAEILDPSNPLLKEDDSE